MISIQGGDAVWGNTTFAPDDLEEADHTHGDLIAFRGDTTTSDSDESHAHPVTPTHDIAVNMTASEASTWILERTPLSFQKMIATNYSWGIERDEDVLRENAKDHRKWTNPLEVQLPNAPTTKIFCTYGVGKDTEVRFLQCPLQYPPLTSDR